VSASRDIRTWEHSNTNIGYFIADKFDRFFARAPFFPLLTLTWTPQAHVKRAFAAMGKMRVFESDDKRPELRQCEP
jgi:hypothetical protein